MYRWRRFRRRLVRRVLQRPAPLFVLDSDTVLTDLEARP